MQLPCRATIVEFVAADRTGELELATGERIHFGASACVGFEPRVGVACWLIDTRTTGDVMRARTVNITGIVEPDPLTQVERAWQAKVEAARAAERAEAARRAALGPRLYEVVRERTGFEIPTLYRRMERDGVLGYSGPARPVLACHNDFAWLSREDVAAWEPPRHWSDSVVLVPFAKNNRGDLWCWCPTRATNDGVPVVFAAADVNEAEVLARDFEAWLVIETLQVCGGAHDIEPDHLREELRADLEVLQSYVREAWFALLREVAERSGALKQSELEEIARRERLVDSIGEVFPHMKPNG